LASGNNDRQNIFISSHIQVVGKKILTFVLVF